MSTSVAPGPCCWPADLDDPGTLSEKKKPEGVYFAFLMAAFAATEEEMWGTMYVPPGAVIGRPEFDWYSPIPNMIWAKQREISAVRGSIETAKERYLQLVQIIHSELGELSAPPTTAQKAYDKARRVFKRIAMRFDTTEPDAPIDEIENMRAHAKVERDNLEQSITQMVYRFVVLNIELKALAGLERR